MANAGLRLASVVLGWAYVACWGVSLYPPVLLNRRLRSVEGMSLDFAFLNFFGCFAYFVSVAMLYYSPTVRKEYKQRHKTLPLYRFNDVVYGAHSLLLVTILLSQFFLAGYKRSITQRLSPLVKLMAAGALLAATGLLLHAWEISTTKRHYELVDVANIFGTVKVFLSGIKYVPQAYHNYKRKSTKGFAAMASLLDILGAVFSITQLVIDAYLAGDIADAYKHPVKLLLALVTTLFGIVFVVQHYQFRNYAPPLEKEKLPE